MSIDRAALISISTLFDSKCGICERPISQGNPALWDRAGHKVYHYACVDVPEQVNRTLTLDGEDKYTLSFEKKNYYLETLVRQIVGVVQDGGEWHIEKPIPSSARQLLDLAE